MQTDQKIEHTGGQDRSIPAKSRVSNERADERQPWTRVHGPRPRVHAGGRGSRGHAEWAGEVHDQVGRHADEPNTLKESHRCIVVAIATVKRDANLRTN